MSSPTPMNEELSTLQQFFVDYDIESDSLLFRFAPPEDGETGIQLSSDVVVYVDFATKKATALLLLNFRLRGGAGAKFPVHTGMASLSNDERQVLLPLLQRFPVSFFLRMPKRQKRSIELVRPTQDQLNELVHAQ